MIDIAEFSADFERRYNSRPQIFSAPGRVNLIGEHTDYNEGFVLPFAIDKRTFVGCKSRDDGGITVHSRTIDQSATIRPGDAGSEKGWSLYVKGMAEVLRRRGTAIKGADLLIDSDIPFGAGLSSSAALEVSVGLALASIGGNRIDMVDLAFAGQEVEHEYIGVRSGIMDQFTSALAAADQALLIDCRSMAFEKIPMELGDLALVVCDSKVEHELADTEYNKRRAECEEGVEILKSRFPAIRSLRDVSLADLDKAAELLPEVIRRRCRHVLTENDRTLKTAAALRIGDFEQIGGLMYRSHESLRSDYEVSCAELELLVNIARDFDGVIGARMTGGGFGGCTINLLEKERTESFKSYITDKYQEGTGRETDVFSVVPSAGAYLHSEGQRS